MLFQCLVCNQTYYWINKKALIAQGRRVESRDSVTWRFWVFEFGSHEYSTRKDPGDCYLSFVSRGRCGKRKWKVGSDRCANLGKSVHTGVQTQARVHRQACRLGQGCSYRCANLGTSAQTGMHTQARVLTQVCRIGKST